MFIKQLFKEKEEKKKRSNSKVLYTFGIISFIIFITTIGYYLFVFRNFIIDANVEHFAQFGDFFGGVLNPIFAFLAFIALLYTIKLQSEALKMSKNELEATRKELTESRIAQQEQSKSLELRNEATELQIFENTFFQLLDLFNNTRSELVIKLEYSKKTNTLNNIRTIYIKVNNIDVRFYRMQVFKEEEIKSYLAISKYLEVLKKIGISFDSKSYEPFNKLFERNTGTYFIQSYQILKFINESKIITKRMYSDIFRAIFTKDELEFLFYHCLGSIGKRKFKNLIEEYEIFEHLSINNDIKKRLLEYDIRAFGKNKEILKEYTHLKKNTKKSPFKVETVPGE